MIKASSFCSNTDITETLAAHKQHYLILTVCKQNAICTLHKPTLATHFFNTLPDKEKCFVKNNASALRPTEFLLDST